MKYILATNVVLHTLQEHLLIGTMGNLQSVTHICNSGTKRLHFRVLIIIVVRCIMNHDLVVFSSSKQAPCEKMVCFQFLLPSTPLPPYHKSWRSPDIYHYYHCSITINIIYCGNHHHT